MLQMKLSELKEKFASLRDTYSLPEFDILDHEFDIRDISNENIILREIKERILEKLDDYQKILEGVVQPDTTLISMYESGVFSDSEKTRIYKLYKRFVYLQRFAVQTEIEDGDEKVAEFINVSFKEWLELKEKMLGIIIKLKESWKMDDPRDESVFYCG